MQLDKLDRKLVALMGRDGQQSVSSLAQELQVTGPTVRSRMKNLLRSGVMKVLGLLDVSRTNDLTVALVGICLQSHQQLGQKLDEIAALDRVNWAAVVTGRYDLVVEIVLAEGMNDLYAFLDEDLSSIGGVLSSESFVVMKAKNKWIPLPRGLEDWAEPGR